MKHCIIVKFKNTVSVEDKQRMLPDIEDLFEQTTQIDGVHGIRLLTNCTPRDNRYDLMIEMDMEQSALTEYDDCVWHHRWKNEYGELIEKKAIFDYEEA